MAEVPTDLNSYCFGKKVNLSEVHQSLKFLLIPRDIVEFRAEDNCLDIATSSDRGSLFEKFLSKRYDLKREISETKAQDCRLDLKTTKNSKIASSRLKAGEKNLVNKEEASSKSTSVMELLLGEGLQGELSIGLVQLKMTCRLIGKESASLVIFYAEKNQGNISSEVLVKKGEWTNIGSAVKDLEDKVKTLGIPQTEISQTKEQDETTYELQLK